MVSAGGDLRRRWNDESEPSARRRKDAPEPPATLHWAPFGLSAAASLATVAIVAVLVVFGVAGPRVREVVDQAGQGGAALAAAVSCGLLARASGGKVRTGWALISISTFAGFAIGGLTLAGYLLATGRAAPFPSPADAVYLGGQAGVIVGVLAFPSSPARAANRGRAAIDGLVLGISLLYICWALGLGNVYHSSHLSVAAQLVGLAYPLTDLVAITVLLLVIRKAPRVVTVRLAIFAAGLGVKLVADSGLALTHGGAWGVASSWFDLTWMAAYLLIALAARYPVHQAVRRADHEPTSLWQMLVPWLGMVGVVLSSMVLTVAGRPIDSLLVYPGVALVLLLMGGQLISYRDSLRLLHQSRMAEAALQARTALLNQVVSHAPLGVARIGTDNRFIDTNPRLGTLLHASSKILIGAKIWDFARTNTWQQREPLFKALADGETDTIEEDLEIRRADGSPGWLHTSTTAVRKPDGTIDYFLAMAEDITARHEAEETSAANLAALERLNQMKSEFVSMVSHEFRTALVGIQGFSELIRDETLEMSDIKGLAGDINSDAQRLNRMISEMLDLDRMEAGKIRLNLKPVNINGLLEEEVGRAQATTESHTVAAELDPTMPVVSGDPDRLIQVVSNLLNNAVKYSPQGGDIEVRSRCQDGMVEISVEDHGVGIPAEFSDRIFGRYERFESNRAGKVVGTGLGLAISHQIVELHGGRMWLASEPGRGSTFFFTVPVATGAAEPA